MLIVLLTLIHGFFGKQQYATIALQMLTIKLSKALCLECSTCAIFLSSSLMVSIMARFLRSSLSETDINAPSILLFNLVIQPLKQVLSYISLISDKLPVDELHKGVAFKGFTVIHITESNYEIQEFSTLVTYQMQLEPEEPAHGAFTSFRYSFEYLMYMDSLVFAYP